MSSATAPVWTLTNYGLGLVFTGDTVTLPTGSVFSTLGDFTVNATFIFGGGTGYQSLFAFGASGDDFLLGLVNARLLVYAVGVGESLPGSVLTSGTYYTATWSRLGSGLTFYLNGAVDATASYSATTITLSTSARLIGNDGGGEAFAGTLFDLRIYDRALTREEVLSYHRDYQLMYRLRPSRSFSVVSAGVALVETVTEDVEVSETHFRFLGFSRSVTEDIEVSETNPSFRGLSRVVTEDEEVSTAQSRNLVMVRTQQDDIQISDTVPRRMGMIRSILELETLMYPLL
jgi:hypothetical protein